MTRVIAFAAALAFASSAHAADFCTGLKEIVGKRQSFDQIAGPAPQAQRGKPTPQRESRLTLPGAQRCGVEGVLGLTGRIVCRMQPGTYTFQSLVPEIGACLGRAPISQNARAATFANGIEVLLIRGTDAPVALVKIEEDPPSFAGFSPRQFCTDAKSAVTQATGRSGIPQGEPLPSKLSGAYDCIASLRGFTCRYGHGKEVHAKLTSAMDQCFGKRRPQSTISEQIYWDGPPASYLTVYRDHEDGEHWAVKFEHNLR